MPKYEQLSVKIHPELAENQLIRKLSKDFKQYKKTGINQPLFGRDAPFNDNQQLLKSNIFKVHIIEEGSYRTKASQYENTSDQLHLVYCVHYLNESCYCVIHALTPNAHAKANEQEFISVALRRAEAFQSHQPSIINKKVSNG